MQVMLINKMMAARACLLVSLLLAAFLGHAMGWKEVGEEEVGPHEFDHATDCSELLEICNKTDASELNGFTCRLNESRYLLTRPCRLQDVRDLTITGSLAGTPSTTIQCNSPSILSFSNATSLSVSHLRFEGCGDSIVAESDLRNLSSRALQFFGQHAAALLCNHCLNLSLTSVAFNESRGYSFVGINLHGNVVLDEVNVLGNPSQQQQHNNNNNNNQSGRGVLVFFAHSDFPIVNESEVLLNNSHFLSNQFTGHSDDERCSEVFDRFVAPWDLQLEHSLPDVGALTIVFAHRTFSVNVTVANGNFTDNRGLCFGAVYVLMHTTSVECAHVGFSGCSFVGNSPVSRHDSGRRHNKNYFASDVTIYLQFKGDYFQRECVSMEDIFSQAVEGYVNTPSFSVIHFPDTSS